MPAPAPAFIPTREHELGFAWVIAAPSLAAITVVYPASPSSRSANRSLLQVAGGRPPRPGSATDVEMLVRWHADPEVAPYWDGKTYTHEQIRERLERPHVDAYVVEADGQPVGYLQAWFGETADVGGLDMFLIPSARGHGIGPDAAGTLAGYLLDQEGRLRVTVDPYLSNERAVDGWKKAGFRLIEECEPDDEHLERWLLMEFDPSPILPPRQE